MEASARRKGTKGRNRSRRMPRIARVVDRVPASIGGNFRGEMRRQIATLDLHWIVCAEVCEGAKRDSRLEASQRMLEVFLTWQVANGSIRRWDAPRVRAILG